MHKNGSNSQPVGGTATFPLFVSYTIARLVNYAEDIGCKQGSELNFFPTSLQKKRTSSNVWLLATWLHTAECSPLSLQLCGKDISPTMKGYYHFVLLFLNMRHIHCYYELI